MQFSGATLLYLQFSGAALLYLCSILGLCMATVCKICVGPIEPPDQHYHCVACLGLAHAEAALDESDCGNCAVPGLVCLNRPYVVWFVIGPGRAAFLAWRVWYIVPKAWKAHTALSEPMTENVLGYSLNPCSLNRERDAAFAAKLLTLPTGIFSAEKSEEQMARSPV